MVVNGRAGSEQQLVRLVQRYEQAAARAFTLIYQREGNLRETLQHVIDTGVVSVKESEVWHAALVARNGIMSRNPYYASMKLSWLRGHIGRIRPIVNKVERAAEALALSVETDRPAEVLRLQPRE
jgi:hypothetical protein